MTPAHFSASPTPTPRWSAASWRWRWIRRPSSRSAKEGLINVRDFTIKGEGSLDRVAAGGPPGAQNGIAFSRLRAEFTRQNGQLSVREGVVKGPTIGATIEGSIDYPGNQVRMSGTFVPMYGLNNMFGQIPIVGLFLGGGSNEGLIGVTYEVVGTPGQPVLRVNPISAMAPGVLRKIFEFGTGKQYQPGRISRAELTRSAACEIARRSRFVMTMTLLLRYLVLWQLHRSVLSRAILSTCASNLNCAD